VDKKAGAGKPATPQIRIGVETAEDHEKLERILGRADHFRREQAAAKGSRAFLTQIWEVVPVNDIKEALKKGIVDVAIHIRGELPVRRAVNDKLKPEAYRNREITFELFSLADSGSSLKGKEEVELRLLWFQQAMVAWRMDVEDPDYPIVLAHLENVSL